MVSLLLLLHVFLHSLLLCHRILDFFNTIRVSNSLDPDQARHFVGPDLGPNCLQRLLAVGSNFFHLAKVLVCFLLVLLLYVPSQQQWSLQDGQFT